LDSLQYEEFVKATYEVLVSQQVGAVYFKKSYIGKRSGHDHEIDVSIELTIAGLHIIILVECKHYTHKVDISDVLEFAQRLDDIGAHKGVMVTTVGYQDGALRVAESHNLALVATVPQWHNVMSSVSDALLTGSNEPALPHKTERNEPAPPHETIAIVDTLRQERSFSEAWRAVVNELSERVMKELCAAGHFTIQISCIDCGRVLQPVNTWQCPRCFATIEGASFVESTWYKCSCAKMIHITDRNAIKCVCGKITGAARVDRIRLEKLDELLQIGRTSSSKAGHRTDV